MRQNHVDAVHTERITLRTSRSDFGNRLAYRPLLAFAFALFKGVQIVQQVMPYFLEILGDVRPRYFSFNSSITPSTSTDAAFLLQIAQLALLHSTASLPVNNGELLSKLLVLSLYILLRYRRLQLPFMHHLRNILDGHHLSIEHRKISGHTALACAPARIAREQFALGHMQVGAVALPEIFPVLDGQMVPIEDISKMVHEGKLESTVAEDIERKYEQFRQEFTVVYRKTLTLSRELASELSYLEQEAASVLVDGVIEELKEKYPGTNVAEYLEEVRHHLLDNLDPFKEREGEGESEGDTPD